MSQHDSVCLGSLEKYHCHRADILPQCQARTPTMASRSAESLWQSGTSSSDASSFVDNRSSLIHLHSASSLLRGVAATTPNAGPSRLTASTAPPMARWASTTTSASASGSKLQPLLPASAPVLPALPSTMSEAVSLIQSSSTPQLGRYVLARLHSRNYLLHPRDVLTVPHLKGSPPPGTVLSLNRILQVGSRDYVIKAPEPSKKQSMPFGTQGDREVIPQEVVQCHLTVMEHTKSPMERKLLKKRRKGYKKTIENKQGWTRLRVGDVLVGSEAR